MEEVMTDDGQEKKFVVTPTHGERYLRYNIYGHLFEVTAKYVPPITPIGRGAYGVVCSFVNSETKENVAIKKIVGVFDDLTDAKRTVREITLLRHMYHENIISIRDVIPPPVPGVFNDVYIVTELMDTDLESIISSNQVLQEEHFEFFLYQILRGLKYIHSANILHRDLKPSNLLLTENCDLKICDFGLARPSDEEMTEIVVTKWYRAPELLLGSSHYTTAIDVWSVGCIFMELINRKPLFPGKDHNDQMLLVIQLVGTPTESELGFVQDKEARIYMSRLERHPRKLFAEEFPHVHQQAIDLVERMLTFDPSKRITVEEALAHPYLAKLHELDDEPASKEHFTFDFNQDALTEDQMKELIYKESLLYNPQHM